jgi:hypothetical protein
LAARAADGRAIIDPSLKRSEAKPAARLTFHIPLDMVKCGYIRRGAICRQSEIDAVRQICLFVTVFGIVRFRPGYLICTSRAIILERSW